MAIGQPRISVVIPAYNAEKHIRQCIESVLSQSACSFEIILVVNKSADRTIEICKAINDYRVKIFEIENGGSIAVSRNFGLRKATGTLISFLDADDFMTPDKLFTDQKLFDDEGYDAIIGAAVPHFERGFGYSYRIKIGLLFKLRALYGLLVEPVSDGIINPAILSTLTVRRDILDSLLFEENLIFRGYEDYIFLMTLKKSGSKITFKYRPQIYYRVHNQSVSAQDPFFWRRLGFFKKRNFLLGIGYYYTAAKHLSKKSTLKGVLYFVRKFINSKKNSYL